MKDFTTEIKEDLRQESLAKFGQKYGKYFLCLALACIVIATVYAYINNRNLNKQEKISTEYFKLFTPGLSSTPTANDEILNFIAKHKGNIYAEIAALMLTGIKPEIYAPILFEIATTSTHTEVITAAQIKLGSLALENNMLDYKNRAITLLQKSVKKGGYMINTMKIILGQLLIDGDQEAKAQALLSTINQDSQAPDEAKFIANVLGE